MGTLRKWVNRLWGRSERAAPAARLQAGGNTQAVEAPRDQRRLPWLEDLTIDGRYACRALAKNPGFTIVAVLSVALGTGANTAIFSLINTLMLRTLPVLEPNQLVELLSRYPGEPRSNGFSWRVYEHYREGSNVFTDLVGTASARLTVSGDGLAADTVNGEYVVGNFFQALGLKPAIGRLIDPRDDRLGADSVAVVSWSHWQNRLNRNPSVLGQQIIVAGVAATVVGVAPREFTGLQVGIRTDLWVPVAMHPAAQPGSERLSDQFGVKLIGRLRPGVSIDRARAELRVLDRWRIERLAQVSGNPRWREAQIEVESAAAGFSALRDAYVTPLTVLMAMVGLLLAISCTNVSSMLLARGAARQREMAVRKSLGAGRFRLVRQALTESMVLAAAGSVLGVFLAYAGVNALVRILASGRPIIGFPGPLEVQVQPDAQVLLFTVGIALLTGLLFGLAPALNLCANAPGMSLQEAARAGESRFRRRFGNGLVVTQVALSVVLLSTAGLFVRQVWNLRNLDRGFERDSLLLVTLDPADSGYQREELARRYQELLQRLETVPGVRSATLSGVTPIQGAGAARFVAVEGFQEQPDARRYVSLNWVAPKYFETLGTSRFAGRDFQFEDAGRPRVAIVNQAMARHYFRGRSPVGQHFTFDGQDVAYEIVGVVGDAKYIDLRKPPPPTIYLNAFQEGRGGFSHFALRTTAVPAAVVAEVRRTVGDLLNTVRVVKVTTMSEQMDASIVPERLVASLAAMFGGIGALLAAIGLYGLLAYTVARRVNEIGIRMALGATQRDVTAMVLKSALRLVCAGLVIGVPIAIWSQRVAASVVQNLPVDTALPMAVVGMSMIAVGLLAAYVPARRASGVNPTQALRCD